MVGPFFAPDRTRERALIGLEELSGLCRAAGIVPVGSEVVHIRTIDPALYIGSGQADRIIAAAAERNAAIILFDLPLSPVHLRNLARRAGTEVYDRHAVILEIFSRRARSREAQLQVELARARYAQSHLAGMWQHLSRQGGGSRLARGEGEKQIEVDRRVLADRVHRARRGLDRVARHRARSRSSRSSTFRVALVGYTNAGKSSLLNALTNARVAAVDRLFATLDPSTRRLKPDSTTELVFSDTVGFIDRLPPELIEAFHSTLEEAIEADVILIVLDAANRLRAEHLQTTTEILGRIGATKSQRMVVLNKCDLVDDGDIPEFEIRDHIPDDTKLLRCSATSGIGIAELRDYLVGRARRGS